MRRRRRRRRRSIRHEYLQSTFYSELFIKDIHE